MKSYLHDPVGHHAVNITVRLRTDDIEPIRHLAKRTGYRVTVDSDFGLQLSFERHDKPPDKRSRAPISVPTTCQPLFGISVPMSQGTENVPSGAFPAGLSAGLFSAGARCARPIAMFGIGGLAGEGPHPCASLEDAKTSPWLSPGSRRLDVAALRAAEASLSPLHRAALRCIRLSCGCLRRASGSRGCWRRKNQYLPSSTKPRYVATIAARMAKKSAGRESKPSVSARGENGMMTPAATHRSVVASSGGLGRLRKNGTRWVRMMKFTSVWVARDSTNQPLWNSVSPASKTQIITPNVMKSYIELIGPKNIMNRRMNEVSQWAGRLSSSSSTLSVGMVISLTSYRKLFSRIWVGSIGRNDSTSEPPAALNMFP